MVPIITLVELTIKMKGSIDVRSTPEDLNLWRGDRCSKTHCRHFDAGAPQFIMASHPNPI